MKRVAIACNVVLFAFTAIVLIVDGPPREIAYLLFTAWLLLTLAISATAIARLSRPHRSWRAGRIVAVVLNLGCLVWSAWAYVDRYPHPDEQGFVAFLALLFLTPVLSVVVLLREGRWALASR